MIAASFWQSVLGAFGTALAFLYDIVRNYGVAIILLTILIRIILLPLTLKQTRSMQAMQKIQPLVKEIQKKYKGNRQKMNEELMKVYRENRVNPAGGCLPLLMQLPVFFALYAVLRGDPNKITANAGALSKIFHTTAAKIPPSIAHLPWDSRLAKAIVGGHANFLGMNLACPPTAMGRGSIAVAKGAQATISCGSTWAAAIPAFILVALMVFTTWYQQKQMQSLSGQTSQQMQLMGKIMPIFLGFISLQIPAGVLLYWASTNAWQVGQQHFMIRNRRAEESSRKGDGGKRDGPKSSGSVKMKELPPKGGGPKQVPKGSGRPQPNKGAAKGGSPGGAKGGSSRNGRGSRKKRRKR